VSEFHHDQISCKGVRGDQHVERSDRAGFDFFKALVSGRFFQKILQTIRVIIESSRVSFPSLLTSLEKMSGEPVSV